MKNKRTIDKEIAEAIHYPKCWDTIAYPTLATALWEMVEFPESINCQISLSKKIK